VTKVDATGSGAGLFDLLAATLITVSISPWTATGGAYVTGEASTNFPTAPGGAEATAAGRRDAFVAKIATLPTSTDQCKHGGWKTFGVFKNQGDCVSFLASNGKNPPSGS
jgi:hypothetical protein